MRSRVALTAALLCCFAALPARAAEVDFEHDPSLPVVNINVAVKAGTTTDPDGQSGLTNFLGEMLLRGTRRRTKEQIDLALDQMGAQLEVETRAEAMILRGAVLSSQLKPFLDLLGELIDESSFPETEIRKLKSETVSAILEETGSDSSLARRRFERQLFRGHPYGKPILGTVKDVEKLSRDKLLVHYNRLIRGKYLLVVGSGDAEAPQIKAWAERMAKPRAAINAPDIARVDVPENPPARRLVVIDKPERTQTQIYLGQIGVRMTDAKYFPLFVGNYAFGGHSFSSRLMQEIRVKRGWSYGAYSNFRAGLRPRYWAVYLFPQDKVTPPAVAKTLSMIEELKQNGIGRDEFEFARSSLINSAGFMYDTPRKRVENRLLELTLELPEGFMKSYAPEIAKLDLGQVNSALQDFLKPDQLTTVLVGTAKDLKEPLAQAVGMPAGKVEVIPYTQE